MHRDFISQRARQIKNLTRSLCLALELHHGSKKVTLNSMKLFSLYKKYFSTNPRFIKKQEWRKTSVSFFIPFLYFSLFFLFLLIPGLFLFDQRFGLKFRYSSWQMEQHFPVIREKFCSLRSRTQNFSHPKFFAWKTIPNSHVPYSPSRDYANYTETDEQT